MTVPASVVMGAGLRAVRLYELDTASQLLKPGTMAVPYGGVHLQGAHVLNINDPEPRRITHLGEDRPLGLTILPATEFVSGELRSAKRNLTVDALVSGTAVVETGEIPLFGIGTDRRGYESQVCVLAYSVSQDADEDSAAAGQQLWDILILPKAKIIQRQGNRDDNAIEMPYTLSPFPTTKYPWGMSFSMSVEKYKTAAALSGVTVGLPLFLSAIGDNTTAKLTFPTGTVAIDDVKVAVFVNGVQNSASVDFDVATDLQSLTFVTASIPATTDIVNVVMEIA